MPKQARELTAIEIRRIETPGLHAVGGVPGLCLQVLNSGAKSWVLRFSVGSRRREMGLGGFPAVTLSMARDSARLARAKLSAGLDPIRERKASLRAMATRHRAELTFDECARLLIEAKSAEWSSRKHAAQWAASLDAYASPVIGRVPVAEVGMEHVLKILESNNFWLTKTTTASRVRGRIEAVLDWAAVRGYRDESNPARWKGRLDKVLASPQRLRAGARHHHPALAVAAVGTFMESLRAREGLAARALEFLVLTAARSGEVTGMCWSEIDLDHAVWTIPAARMKARREHRVPLSERADAILRGIPAHGPFVFCPESAHSPLSGAALRTELRRLAGVGLSVHGFRSTFRDWAAERTNYPREVTEAALAHAIESKVEAAYRRTDLFERRRRLMADWARYCEVNHRL